MKNSMLPLYSILQCVIQVPRITECQILGMFISHRKTTTGEIEQLAQGHPREVTLVIGGFPGGAVVKNQPANAGDTGSIPGPGRSHMLGSS